MARSTRSVLRCKEADKFANQLWTWVAELFESGSCCVPGSSVASAAGNNYSVRCWFCHAAQAVRCHLIDPDSGRTTVPVDKWMPCSSPAIWPRSTSKCLHDTKHDGAQHQRVAESLKTTMDQNKVARLIGQAQSAASKWIHEAFPAGEPQPSATWHTMMRLRLLLPAPWAATAPAAGTCP